MREQAAEAQRSTSATSRSIAVADYERERVVDRETVVVDAGERGGGGVIAAIALLIVVLAALYYFGMLPI